MLSENVKENMVDLVRSALASTELIYLFGSAATSFFSENSDIDLAILASNDPSVEACMGLIGLLRDQTQREIDLVMLNEANTVLKKEIVTKGELIYSKEEEKKVSFENKVYQEYLTLNDDRRPIIEGIFEDSSIYG